MIQYLEKIENLGVFTNYKKPNDMKAFKRFNLIYGMNGSGKTTLSRFFSDLNEGEAAGFPNLKYKIKTDEGDFIQGKPYARKIRVFNAEYVEDNIGEIEGTLNPIFVLGAENKSLADQVKVDEKKLDGLLAKRSQNEDELVKKERDRGKIFSRIAQKIAEETKTRSYNKKHAEAAYTNASVFTSSDLKELAAASSEMNQSAMGKHDEYLTPNISVKGKLQPFFTALQEHCDNIEKITLKSATSIAIERLTKNPEIAVWVEQGFHIHAKNDSKDCEYCQQEIPKVRKEELAAHFNDSDNLLKKDIESAIAHTRKFVDEINKVNAIDSQLFYPELQPEHISLIEVLKKQKIEIIGVLQVLEKTLEEKLTRRTESYNSEVARFTKGLWHETISKLNDVIKRHNSETDNFETRKKNNFKKIEEHFLSTIDSNVKDIDTEIESLKGIIDECNKGDSTTKNLGINALETLITDNRAKIANSHQAATELSKKLSSFLGRDDLKFETEGDGYRITRFGRAAKLLSEGEKTAITFLYFVVGLTDQDFELAEGIVVIDDPISSLDSSSVYQAFAYLKNAVRDAKQVFLLTHNFEFLKLLLDWLTYGDQKDKTYWMLHCSNSSVGTRETEIKPLDEILIKNRNEFVFLFKTLVDFKSDGTVCQSYPIPNIVRKVLETFLAQHSTGKSFYKRLDNLEYDETIKTALYKYTNDLSHPTLTGLDPALVGETQTNVKHLLEMIETIAPVHYNSITKTIASYESKAA